MATFTIGPSACTGTAPTGYHEFSGKVVLNETVNNADNSSTIAWSFYIYVNRAAYVTGYSQSWGNYVSVTIDGKNVFPQQDIGAFALGDGTQAGTHYESNPVLVKSGTLTVKHDDNGKKNLSVTAVYSNSRSTATYLGTITVSGSVALTNINRAATLTQPADLTLTDAVYGTSLSLSWTDTEERYYKLQCKYRDAVLIETSVMHASAYVWGVMPSVAQAETAAKSMNCTIVLQTYEDANGETLLGSDSKQITISLDESAFRPTFAPFATQVTWNDKLSSSIVAGQSYAVGSWYAYGIQHATIVSEECTYVDADGNELVPRVSASNGATLPVIPAFSDLTKQIGVKIFLTDSRGFTTVSNTLSTQTVYGWMAPTITSLSAVRCDSQGTESLTGNCYKLTVSYSIRPLNNANAKNMAIKYKYQSASSYTQSSSGAVTNYSGTLNMGPYALSSAQDEKLEVLVEVWDSFSSSNKTTMSVIILPATVFMDIMTSDTTKIGLGIGMVSGKANTVQLGWDLELHDCDISFYDSYGTQIDGYVPSQYVATLPSTQSLFLEKLNDDTLLLEPVNLQTIRDCRLLGFQFRSGAKNHVVIDRCYFSGDSATPVFDFDSNNWVGSIKVIGCESYFRPYFITADSKDMTDVYFTLCTLEGAKQLMNMKQNAIIRMDSCYIGDQRSVDATDGPYIEMSDNTKLIITNSQIGSNGKGDQPFIKCGAGCQVLIKDSNLIMTNQADPVTSRFINYGGAPFDGAAGCDFTLDNVTWNIIPRRVNWNHNMVALACRKDGWHPKSNTPVKNYGINPFFLDTTMISGAWVDVTADSTSPFYEYLNPYNGHIYSLGTTQQEFGLGFHVPAQKVGQKFYMVLFLNAQIPNNGATPYWPSSSQYLVNVTDLVVDIITGANNMVAPNSLDGHIYEPVMNIISFTPTAETGSIAIGRNTAQAFISGFAVISAEDITKFPVYDNLY